MLASRWNQVKDPEAKESLRLIEQAINQGFAALGIDPMPTQQNPIAQGGTPITAPQAPLALSIASVSGGVLVQITANPANIKPVNYFVETSASASFTNVTVYRFGLLQTDTINIGTATLFFRCRCQYFSSGFSPYVLFGNPTAVTGGSSALGATTGSGAVVLQTGPTINGATLGATTFNNTSLVFPSPWGFTQKSGNAGGNYTTTSASYVDVDGTNLAFTVTIPTGWKLSIVAACGAQASASQNCFIDLFDGANSIHEQYTNSGVYIGIPLCAVVNGDGASHTIKLKYKTDGVNTLTIPNNNGNGLQVPIMIFALLPSN